MLLAVDLLGHAHVLWRNHGYNLTNVSAVFGPWAEMVGHVAREAGAFPTFSAHARQTRRR